jgi:glycosyltransferase involved in cell wall biosynthesis
MTKLSVVIISFNEEQNILRCIQSVTGLADEIIVVDSHSEDKTALIARTNGCKVIARAFDGYGTQKQFAVEQARNNWILSLDADECITPELKSEIAALIANDQPSHPGYLIPRNLVYLGRIMKYSGTGNEKLLRLFDRDHGRFNDVRVHERVILDSKPGLLKNKMLHYSYRDLSHHMTKTNEYTSHAAAQNRKSGKSYPGAWVAFKFPVSFITFYIFKGGILDGYPGMMWSFMASVYGSVKIAKTIEIARKK